MPAPVRSPDELIAVLHGAFPPPDPAHAVRIEELTDSTIRMRAPIGDRPLRPGDTVSGPTLFTIADAVAWMLTLAHLEPGRDAVTSSVTMQFLRRPQYRFSIKTFAENSETARSIATVLAESCFRKGQYTLVPYAPVLVGAALEAATAGRLSGEPDPPGVFGDETPPEGTRVLRELTRLATAEELVGVFRLPVAGRSAT